MQLATLDLSFISVLKVLSAVCSVLTPDGALIVLIKPQFEAGKSEVGPGHDCTPCCMRCGLSIIIIVIIITRAQHGSQHLLKQHKGGAVKPKFKISPAAP